jgi:hypothetical protein
LKALYAQSFALVTPANKDADENHLIVPIKPMAVGSSVNPDQPCIPTSDAESGHTSSPISQITNMDTEDYTFNNIDPLPYNDEQIALYGCLGNQFVDFMNSPDGDEVENSFILTANDIDDEEQLPNLPEVESMTTVSPYPFAFYPPHWPLFSGPPPTYYCGKYAYITHPDDHSATSASILYPKPPSNRRFGQPLLTSPEQQDLIQEANENDVLCGRGGAINNHPGNRRFRDLINEFKYQYLHESKQTKPKVAMRVLELVKQSNPPGRFLMKFPQGYLECSEDRAKEKGELISKEKLSPVDSFCI